MKSEEIQAKSKERYQEGLNYARAFSLNENKKYYTLEFEDLLKLFCVIIKDSAGMSVRLELGKEKTSLFLILFANENQYAQMAENFGTELQLKPVATQYEYFDEIRRKTEREYELKKLKAKKKELQEAGEKNQQNNELSQRNYH